MSYIGVPPFGQTVRTLTELTASAAQAVFNISGGYLPGYIDVFLNGSSLASSDFTATNGTTVTLLSAAAVGDEFKAIAYWPVSLVDTYRKSESDALLTGKVNKAGDTMTGSLTAPNLVGANGIQGVTGSGNFGVRVIAKDDSSVATLQFTNNPVSLEWATLNAYSSGAIATPKQPMFRCRGSGGAYAQTAGQITAISQILENVGGCYSNSTHRFTAPTTGKYLFWVNLFGAGGSDRIGYAINGNYQTHPYIVQTFDNAVSGSIIVHLNSNDYLIIFAQYGGSNIYLDHCGWGAYFLG